MHKTPIIATLCVLVTCVLAFQTSPSVAGTRQKGKKPQTDTCTGSFEATVRLGPSAGTSFAGTLTVELDAQGALSGSLTTPDDQTIPVVGQVTGRAIHLAFELQKPDAETPGLYLFGTGTAWTNIASATQCGGVVGGTFAGPTAGDIGDWGYATWGMSTKRATFQLGSLYPMARGEVEVCRHGWWHGIKAQRVTAKAMAMLRLVWRQPHNDFRREMCASPLLDICAPLLLNQATQHWPTGHTRQRAISVYL